MLVALLGFAALAIDVSRAYASQRFYRAVADASSLAGAQDLQGNTRAVTNANRTNARTHALQVLKDQLGATGDPVGAGCDDLSVNLSDCALPGTDYFVSIKTPSPTCVFCAPTHSVQVTVRNPVFWLSFARVLGQDQWNVSSTSVAGLTFSSHYALITLRPPKPLPNGLDQNREDIDVDGTRTRLNILQGDVGTNTSAFTNSGARITLASGYFIDHIDDITPDPWWQDPVTGEPVGRLITDLIEDPDYPYPTRTGADLYPQQSDGVDPACTGAPTTGPDVPPAGAVCYMPGIYQNNFNVQNNSDVAYLLSGAYFFDRGIDVRGTLLGGVQSNERGVVIVVPQSETFTANNAIRIWLNKGGVGCNSNACRALPALDEAGTEMKTPDGLVLTIEVTKDSSCFSGTTPVLCNRNPEPNTIRMPGNGQLYVAGVIYAPTDNVLVAGDNSGQTGVVGQIVSWTVKYTGGAQLNQEYPAVEELGILRLDAACTTPSTPCNSP